MSKSPNKQSVEAEELEKSYQLPDIVQQRQHTLKKLSVKLGEKILDVGCGVGFLSHEIAILTGGSGLVCGVDKNLEMIRHANKRCESLKNAEFSEANAEDLPFPEESFDAACCTQVLLYVNRAAPVYNKLHQKILLGKVNLLRLPQRILHF